MKKKQKGLRRVCAWALAAAMILGGGITFPDASLTAEAEETVITGVNYAPGGTATASDEETDDLVAANAIDGDSKTRWGTNYSADQQPRNLTVDLGVSRTFNRFVIEWERTNITNFEISISDDNISYTPVYTKNDSQNIESTTSDIPLQEAKTARYVKL